VNPTRLRTLLVTAAVCALAAWLAVGAAFAGLAPLPWTAIPALLLLAAAETAIARNLTARLTGRGGAKPPVPMAVARLAAFAKASSVAAAVFGGLAAGFLIYVAGSLGKTIPRHDAIVAGSTLAAAVLLAAAALYLERCCRAPRPPDEDDFPPPADGQRPRHR
jgi:hypothetical protein